MVAGDRKGMDKGCRKGNMWRRLEGEWVKEAGMGMVEEGRNGNGRSKMVDGDRKRKE